MFRRWMLILLYLFCNCSVFQILIWKWDHLITYVTRIHFYSLNETALDNQTKECSFIDSHFVIHSRFCCGISDVATCNLAKSRTNNLFCFYKNNAIMNELWITLTFLDYLWLHYFYCRKLLFPTWFMTVSFCSGIKI